MSECENTNAVIGLGNACCAAIHEGFQENPNIMKEAAFCALVVVFRADCDCASAHLVSPHRDANAIHRALHALRVAEEELRLQLGGIEHGNQEKRN